MAKRRRKSTTTQQIANLATVGMPAPVQSVVRTRWGALLLVVLVPVLLLTGILTVQWKDGRPQFRFHADRAQEIRQEIGQEIRKEYGGKLPLPQLSHEQSLLDKIPGTSDSRPQVQIPTPQISLTPPAKSREEERPRPLARIREAIDSSRR